MGSEALPVPETDTGGLIEEIQADERTLVKELGKLIPYLWKKGCSPSCTPLRWKRPREPQSPGPSDWLPEP